MTKKYSSFKNHQLITENWRKFVNEDSNTWENEEAVLASLKQQGYESLGGPENTSEQNDTDTLVQIGNMLTSDYFQTASIEEWISTLDGEWIIHPAKEKERIEKQKQREKDPEYQKRWDRINRKQAEMAAAVGSIDWETTDLGHPKGLEELKQTS
tara:strand:+ start:64 stop:528 length:465 start_codon:yes stop_codon:yes gene_type:complete